MVNLNKVGEYVSNIKHEVKRFTRLSLIAVGLVLLAACGGAGPSDASAVHMDVQQTSVAMEVQPGFTEVKVNEVYKLPDGSCGANLTSHFLGESKQLFPLDCGSDALVFKLVMQENGYLRISDANLNVFSAAGYCILPKYYDGNSHIANTFRKYLPNHKCQ